MVACVLRRTLGFVVGVMLAGSSAFAQVPAAPVNDYVYTLPPAWTATPYPDGLVLMSPPSATNERCVFTVWPMRPAGTNLLQDASAVFQDVFRTYEPRPLTTRGTPMPSSVARGTSGQGWDYVIVRRGVGPRGSTESRLGFVLVVKLNARLAVISGVSQDPLVSTCMGELAGNVWPRFFYSLSFKNWPPSDQSTSLRENIPGTWIAAIARAASEFVFAANGRYGDAAASQQSNRINSTEALQTTQAYFGKGAFTLRGNTITLTPDNQREPPETGFIRVEEESADDGRTWTQTLYLLRVSAVDGRDYEVRYTKP
jgi:hypothetical protein